MFIKGLYVSRICWVDTHIENQSHFFTLSKYSRSSIQNSNHWEFWIRKANALLNLINNPYLIKDMHEEKYQYLIKKHKKNKLKTLQWF